MQFFPIVELMKNSIFAAFAILVFSFFVCIHLYMRNSFSGMDLVQMKLQRSEKELEEIRLQAQLRDYEMNELRMSIASQLPSSLKQKFLHDENYRIRNLASVVQDSTVDLPTDQGSSLFESGKRAFREKDFEGAVVSLEEFQRKFSNSSHLPEALFLLAESFFQLQRFESCIAAVEFLVHQFPESELTGFAMLRLAQVYESEDRLEDAGDIYRLIVNWFDNPELKRQADTALKRIENQ